MSEIRDVPRARDQTISEARSGLRGHDLWQFRNVDAFWLLSAGVDAIRIPDRCGLDRFVQPNRTACADSGDQDFDCGRECPRRLPLGYAWNRDPSQLSATKQPSREPLARSKCRKTHAPPLRRCTPCWEPPGPPRSVTAGIGSAVASGRSPSAERPTRPKRSCFTGT